MTLLVEWIDRGEYPEHPPNPKFPLGIDVDARFDKLAKSCAVALPYPSARLGIFMIKCDVCGYTAALTTAGRPDDPRSFTTNCKDRAP